MVVGSCEVVGQSQPVCIDDTTASPACILVRAGIRIIIIPLVGAWRRRAEAERGCIRKQANEMMHDWERGQMPWVRTRVRTRMRVRARVRACSRRARRGRRRTSQLVAPLAGHRRCAVCTPRCYPPGLSVMSCTAVAALPSTSQVRRVLRPHPSTSQKASVLARSVGAIGAQWALHVCRTTSSHRPAPCGRRRGRRRRLRLVAGRRPRPRLRVRVRDMSTAAALGHCARLHPECLLPSSNPPFSDPLQPNRRRQRRVRR